MTKVDKYLKEVKERCDRATEGPWEWSGYDLDGPNYKSVIEFSCDTSFGLSGASENCQISKENEQFIAHSRTDVEVLLKMLEKVITGYAIAITDLTYKAPDNAVQHEGILQKLESLIPKERSND